MKRFFSILLLVLGTAKCFSQDTSDLTDKYLLDFAVPDMPAFKALGTNPSNILRPSDIQKFSSMISPFYSNGSGVIPKNFAAEFAPWKLASRNWTLADYNNGKSFLYNSAFSIGSVKDTTTFPMKLSIGYRFSLLSDKADILRSAFLKAKLASYLDPSLVAFTNLTNHWVINVAKAPVDTRATYYQTHKEEFLKFLEEIEAYLKKNNDAALDDLYKKFLAAANIKKGAKLKNALSLINANADAIIKKYKEDYWNASRLDIALAWTAQSKDSLISKAQFSAFNAWATYALGIHKGGQLLIGSNLALPRTTSSDSVKTKTDFTINLRYYLGTADFRGFLESQYRKKNFSNLKKSLLFNLGAEFRLMNNFWIVLSGGIDNYIEEEKPLDKLVSSIDIRYAFNKPDPKNRN